MMVGVLRLDSEDNTTFRKEILDILLLAKAYNRELYERLLSFPEDLPDLSLKRPPRGNIREQGVDASFFALRARGELPNTYL
jgi:hypothetical protein